MVSTGKFITEALEIPFLQHSLLEEEIVWSREQYSGRRKRQIHGPYGAHSEERERGRLP